MPALGGPEPAAGELRVAKERGFFVEQGLRIAPVTTP
jgi:hypothetical protein